MQYLDIARTTSKTYRAFFNSSSVRNTQPSGLKRSGVFPFQENMQPPIKYLPAGKAWGYETANAMFKKSSFHATGFYTRHSPEIVALVREQNSRKMSEFQAAEARLNQMIDTRDTSNHPEQA